jgi:hypothetical protein
MKAKIGLICAVALLPALLFGCAVASEQGSINLTCDDFMSQKHILGELSVKAGDSFTVTLCANPTTGFQWESAVISDPSVLTETNHQSGQRVETSGPSRRLRKAPATFPSPTADPGKAAKRASGPLPQ